jgi:hypothetical protein
MFDVTERARIDLYLLDSDNVKCLTSPALHFECLLATSAACLSSEVDEKLTLWRRNFLLNFSTFCI